MGKIFNILAFVAVGWIALILLLKFSASRIRRSCLRSVQRILQAERIMRITDNAVYLGAEGTGPELEGRTHGVLALTERAVTFLPWHSANPLVIPRNLIKSAVDADTFLSMTIPGHVLVTEVELEGRGKGRMAWLVAEAGEWARDLGGNKTKTETETGT